MTEFNQIELQHFVDFHTRVTKMPKRQQNLLRDDALLMLMLILVFLTLLGGILLLLVRFWLQALASLDISIKALPAVVTWLVQDNQYLIIGGGLVLASLLFLSLMRVRVLRKHHLWLVSGCPHCHERDLIRIRRLPNDRLLSTLGLPVRRYACRSCTWQGRLLDVRRDPPNSAQPAEILDTPLLADVLPDIDTLRVLEPTPQRRRPPAAAPIAARTPAPGGERIIAPLPAAAPQQAAAPQRAAAPQPAAAAQVVVGAPPPKAAPLKVAPAAAAVVVETAVVPPPAGAIDVEKAPAEDGKSDELHEVLYVKAPGYEQASSDAPEFDPDFERLCYEVALNGRD